MRAAVLRVTVAARGFAPPERDGGIAPGPIPDVVDGLDVGPLRVLSTLPEPWSRSAWAALRRGFTPAPGSAPVRGAVTLSLELVDPPRGALGPSTISLTATGSDHYEGRCGRWGVTLDLSRPGDARAHGQLPPDMATPGGLAAMTTTLTRLAAATALVPLGAFLVHGAALVDPEGRATLFAGPSGAGKTTMTRRLPGWTVLADDTVCVDWNAARGAFDVLGTPFRGSEGQGRTSTRAPLHGVALLEPGAREPSLTPIPTPAAFAALMARVIWFVSGGPVSQALADRVARCVETVPTARLATSLEHDVAALLAVSGEAP